MRLRLADIVLLAALRAAAEQDDQGVPVTPEIQPVAGPPIDPIFEDASTHSLGMGEAVTRVLTSQ